MVECLLQKVQINWKINISLELLVWIKSEMEASQKQMGHILVHEKYYKLNHLIHSEYYQVIYNDIGFNHLIHLQLYLVIGHKIGIPE